MLDAGMLNLFKENPEKFSTVAISKAAYQTHKWLTPLSFPPSLETTFSEKLGHLKRSTCRISMYYEV